MTKRATFQWGVIDDSYVSGVAYPSNAFDNTANNCLQTTEAYGAQQKNDASWLNGKTEDFSFAACSGSRLIYMTLGPKQICNTGSSPNLVVMTAGGNDAQFFNIVDSCIYHSSAGVNYGINYADDTSRSSACAVAIDAANKYLDNVISLDLKNTIDGILASANVKSNSNFLL